MLPFKSQDLIKNEHFDSLKVTVITNVGKTERFFISDKISLIVLSANKSNTYE